MIQLDAVGAESILIISGRPLGRGKSAARSSPPLCEALSGGRELPNSRSIGELMFVSQPADNQFEEVCHGRAAFGRGGWLLAVGPQPKQNVPCPPCPASINTERPEHLRDLCVKALLDTSWRYASPSLLCAPSTGVSQYLDVRFGLPVAQKCKAGNELSEKNTTGELPRRVEVLP